MRIQLLTANSEPHHYISKGVALRKIHRGLAEPIYKHGKLFAVRQLAVIPRSNRQYKSCIPVIKAPRQPETLLLRYPHPDESSFAKQNQKAVWGADQKRWQVHCGE